ncbi:hypothetical protein ACFFTM_21305 [Pseudoduganella plicata]|uniref:Uncharacterized protein n=1 Tax=Pseudoduganella plicata TaxID=321984 RepID=A0A4P7BI90_9BURK|nr:hypothetical protein [Pseudoduganella plicata]QBQ38090.1 hypothetical protein E1742_19285 [Pseudoduganella plicata]GGZ03061.1 hypothetical protein GCM10007388_40880 [Pseudoduganella plicata]
MRHGEATSGAIRATSCSQAPSECAIQVERDDRDVRAIAREQRAVAAFDDGARAALGGRAGARVERQGAVDLEQRFRAIAQVFRAHEFRHRAVIGQPRKFPVLR